MGGRVNGNPPGQITGVTKKELRLAIGFGGPQLSSCLQRVATVFTVIPTELRVTARV